MPRESKRARAERAQEILRLLAEAYPDSRCSLEHGSPYELLVATVLSAQCTDALVNRVTPELFRRYPSPEALADASLDEVEGSVRQVNFYRNKAKALKGLAETLVARHDGAVPRSMDGLVALPGVGRKTANVIRGVAFGESDGVVVDTHVKRVSERLRLTRSDDPEQIEQDLLEVVPPDSRVVFTHRVIDHGRTICVARAPRCDSCVLADVCPTGATILSGRATAYTPDDR